MVSKSTFRFGDFSYCSRHSSLAVISPTLLGRPTICLPATCGAEVARSLAQLLQQPDELTQVRGVHPRDVEAVHFQSGRRLLDEPTAGGGDLSQGGPPVVRVGQTPHQALLLQPVDDVGHAGRVDLATLS